MRGFNYDDLMEKLVTYKMWWYMGVNALFDANKPVVQLVAS